jgi:hypothetical protein
MLAEGRAAMDLMDMPIEEQLRALGQRGVLTRPGVVDELRCQMPECLSPGGREYFERKSHPPSDWSPSVDHVVLKSEGGRLDPDNVRLAHVLCNRVDFAKTHGKKHDKDRGRAATAAAKWAEDHPEKPQPPG